MKKILSIIFMLVALTAASFAGEIEKTALIPAGRNSLIKPLTISATDFVEADDTISIAITNPQKYYQHQTFTTTLTANSGSPSVTVAAYGKVNSGDAWTQIGSTATWTEAANNPVTISSTTPANYNYLLVRYIASSATQKATLTTFDVHTSNAFNIPANSGTLTLSRATSGTVTLTTADNDANAAFTIGAGGTGALTVGDGNSTTAITSSDWAVSATGAMTGIGAITADGLITGTAGAKLNFENLVNDGDSLILDPRTALKPIDLRINNASKLNVDSAGNANLAGTLNAAGMLTFGGYKLPAPIANTDASETLSVAQSGSIVTCSNASGATTITIPDPSAATVGVVYYIVQMADQDLIVTAAANSNSIVCDGVATTDNVTINTGSHKIGAGMIVIGISATKWYVGGLNPESVLTPEAAD